MRNLLRRLSCVGFPALLATALIFGSLVSPLPAQSSNNNSSNNGTGKKAKKAIKYTFGQCTATAASTGVRCLRGVSTKGATACYQHIIESIERILTRLVIKRPGGANRAAVRQAIRGAKLGGVGRGQ